MLISCRSWIMNLSGRVHKVAKEENAHSYEIFLIRLNIFKESWINEWNRWSIHWSVKSQFLRLVQNLPLSYSLLWSIKLIRKQIMLISCRSWIINLSENRVPNSLMGPINHWKFKYGGFILHILHSLFDKMLYSVHVHCKNIIPILYGRI
jgi:hypothetical protein